ncbi:hypothetical protein [Massilia phosphatilytica]
MDEAATSVNELLNMNVSPGRTARDVIKAWVDKRVVHVDWLWDEEEERILEDMKAFLFNTEGGGLLELLDKLIEDYEKMRSTFGKNSREQIEMVLSALTG